MFRNVVALFLSIAVLTIPTVEVPEPDVVPQEAPASNIEEPSQEDILWLARLIYAEAGADYCSDELQLAVGSVVLNRVKSELYPDTIKDVIFDRKHGVQYGCVTNGMIYRNPDERALENAEWLLVNGSELPDNVLGQSDRVVLSGKYKVIDGVVFSYYVGRY